MTIYDVTAWCAVPYYTTFEVDAANINEALEKAKLQAREEYGEPCGGGESDWDEFEITSDGESLRYLTPARVTEIAAPELLDALRRGVNAAQDVVDSWERGDVAGQYALCRSGWQTPAPPLTKRPSPRRKSHDHIPCRHRHLSRLHHGRQPFQDRDSPEGAAADGVRATHPQGLPDYRWRDLG